MSLFRNKKLFKIAASILVVAILARVVSVTFVTVASSDFLNFYVGSKVLLEKGGKYLYEIPANYEIQEKVLGTNDVKNINTFRSLPFIAVFFIPFTFFDVVTAYKIFFFANIFAVIFGVYIFVGSNHKKIGKKTKLLLHLAPFMFMPILSGLLVGQLSVLIALLFYVIYLKLKNERGVFAGLCTFIFYFKLQYIIFWPFLFLISKDRKSFVRGSLVSLLVVIVISIAVSGIDSLASYPQFLALTENSNFGSRNEYSYSLYSLFHSLPVVGQVAKRYLLSFNVFVYVSGLLFFVKRLQKKSVNFDSRFVYLVLFCIPLAVHVLVHDLSILLAAMFILLNKSMKNNKFVFGKDLIIFFLLMLLPSLSMVRLENLGSVAMIALGFIYVLGLDIKKILFLRK